MRTRTRLVPFVLCAMGVVSLVLTGCRKEEEKPEIPASSPQSYMNDPKFMGELKAQKGERQKVMARHFAMKRAYEEALKADPKSEKPETQDLKKKMDALEDEYRALRRKTMNTVRERLTPKKDISK